MISYNIYVSLTRWRESPELYIILKITAFGPDETFRIWSDCSQLLVRSSSFRWSLWLSWKVISGRKLAALCLWFGNLLLNVSKIKINAEEPHSSKDNEKEYTMVANRDVCLFWTYMSIRWSFTAIQWFSSFFASRHATITTFAQWWHSGVMSRVRSLYK